MGPKLQKEDEKERRADATFTKEQEIWIVRKFHQNVSVCQIRRDFRKEFSVTSFRKIPAKNAFCRVFRRFKDNGVAPAKIVGRNKKPADDPLKKKVVTFFKKNPHSSLSFASRILPFSISITTIHRYLKEAGFHPFKPSVGQILTERQMAQRVEFDSWLQIQISINPDFLQIVALSDEKWFVLHQAPNRQNYRQWSIENPHEMLNIKKQGDLKAMCFVCVVDGRILDPVWFTDENGENVSVNTERYIDTLNEKIIPQMKKMKNFDKFWWQQDGASCHCSDRSLDFLRQHFGERIISRRADVIWPSSSPDHNPLDYSL